MKSVFEGSAEEMQAGRTKSSVIFPPQNLRITNNTGQSFLQY